MKEYCKCKSKKLPRVGNKQKETWSESLWHLDWQWPIGKGERAR